MWAWDFFDQVGMSLQVRWAERHNDELAFADVATEVLSSLVIPDGLTATALLEAMGSADRLPAQLDQDAKFGQPPLTVHVGRGFYIAVLFWLEGTTTIHEHGFSGAFRVLQGASIHVGYEFHEQERISAGLRAGEVKATLSEVLTEGATRPIRGGPDGAHSLFHLHSPSATIVARTNGEPWNQPQLDYLRPGLAADPSHGSAELRRRLQGIDALRSYQAELAADVAADLVGRSSPQDGWTVIHHHLRTGIPRPVIDRLVERYAQRMPSLGPTLHACVDELRRQAAITARRRLLTDHRHRLLLGILLNLPDVKHLRGIAEDLYPDRDPIEVIAGIFEELSAPELATMSGLRTTAGDLDHLRRLLVAGDDHVVQEELVRMSPAFRQSDLLASLVVT